jgi:hypothetical protein
MINIEVWLKNASAALEFEATNTYEEGSFFCIIKLDGAITKIPVMDIFYVEHWVEDED